MPEADCEFASAKSTMDSEQLAALLEDAVRINLISDVPVGTFNGGGVDSSLVTSIARKAHTGVLNTFAVGFDDSRFDERVHARRVAEQLGVICHELVIDGPTFASELEASAVLFHDEPLNHANSVPIRLLAQHAKREVTVVLTGEGSDELFGGYPRYRVLLAIAALRSAGEWLPRLLAPVVRSLPGRRMEIFAQGKRSTDRIFS